MLLHEYAHHFMMQYFPAAYPAWYVEGFAEFMMTASFTDRQIEFGKVNANRAYWLVNGTWLPFGKLAGDQKLNRTDETMFYPQSWLAVHYIFSKPETSRAMTAYLQARLRGEANEKAFTAAFGTDFAGFDRQLRRYKAGKVFYTRFDRATARTPVEVAIRALPQSADALLLPRVALRIGQSDERGKALLAQIRKAAADYPADTFAEATLAHGEILFGDRARGTAMLDRMVTAQPNDGELLYLRGYADLLAAREQADRAPGYAQARRWFAKAFKVAPTHVPNFLAYVETRSLAPLTPDALDVLLTAQSLAPQVEEISMNSAVALMSAKRFKEAENLLMVLAADPHGGSLAEAAQALLADVGRRGRRGLA